MDINSWDMRSCSDEIQEEDNLGVDIATIENILSPKLGTATTQFNEISPRNDHS